LSDAIWSKRWSRDEIAEKKRGRSKVLQILESWAPQIGVSKHKSKKKEGKKGRGNMCG